MQDSFRCVTVYGALRSGSTLLRLMLDGHKHLVCPGETDFLVDYLIKDDGGFRYDLEALENDRIYRNHAAQYAEQPLETITTDAFIKRIAGEDRTAVLMLHRRLDRLLDIYPDMRIIHLVRDPRDVARSSINMGWAGTAYHGVDHWLNTEKGWNAIADRLRDDQVLRLTYEDLISDAEGQLRRICDFCGLAYDQGMMRYAEESTYDRPDPSLIEQWRRKMRPRDISLVEGKAGPLLEKAGYAPSGHPVVKPGRIETALLNLRNKWKVWRHRIKRFGLIDPVIVAASKRINLQALGKRAKRRMDEKQTLYLK